MGSSGTLGPMGRVRISGDVAAREFDREWIVLDLCGGNYYGLDELGGKVWHFLEEGMCPNEIADRLVELYAVERGVLLEDIIALADQFLERGLVQQREDAH